VTEFCGYEDDDEIRGEELLCVEHAAERYGVRRDAIYQAVHNGRLSYSGTRVHCGSDHRSRLAIPLGQLLFYDGRSRALRGET
jgi:hypothetical protein